MSAVPIWRCQLEVPANATVGVEFPMICEGDIAVEWTEQPIQLVFPKPENAYTLNILQKEELTNTKIKFVVTSYKAGAHQLDYIRVVQGEKGFEFTKPNWTIKSVLKPNAPNPPYPPFGPWSLSLPIWVYYALIGVFVMVGFFSYRWFKKRRQRLQLKQEIQKYATTLSPLHQFFRDSRGLQRRLHMANEGTDLTALAQELNHEFKLFILRQFQIPALIWTPRQIAAELKKRHRVLHHKVGDQLRKTLRELNRLVVQKQILIKDIEQVQMMALTTAENLDPAKGVRK